MIALLDVALLGGLLYRFRGGITALLPYFGATIPRIIFAVATGGLGYGVGHSWQFGVALALSTFLSEIIPNWSAESLVNWQDRLTVLGVGTLRGFLISAPLIAMQDFNAVLALLAAGAAAGASVSLWKTVAYDVKLIRLWRGYIIEGYWALGEFTFGTLIWGTLIVSGP